MSIERLVSISQRYGKDPEYVLLGGGNTSLKKDGILYVKASGHALSDIQAGGFAALDLEALDQIWKRKYPDDDDQREAAVLEDLMACRLAEETKRPSVEALLHAILPFRYVVHLHPALVNGLTCSQEGEAATARLFPHALWIELVKPGFILAKTVRDRLGSHAKRTGSDASVIFLENHGVFVGAETVDQIDALYAEIMKNLRAALVREVDTASVSYDTKGVAAISATLEKVSREPISFHTNAEIMRLVSDEESFASVASSFTPDHIVYAGFKPLWVDKAAAVEAEYQHFLRTYAEAPKVICIAGFGAFSVTEKPMLLFLDTVAIAAYSESFGGPKFMSEEMIAFIRTWEVEQYRAQVAAK